ncbi:MAG: 3-hydroxybutyryl-CoA dehydrogenase, partial [Bdellovibrionales bacterium]|nr:3-hydroxybutyryl-CoA dehydrogenase [Bdellovibrionales bacterium]
MAANSGFKKIGVLGAGQMGNGIAQVVAMKGTPVVLVDISEEALTRALKTITASLDKLVKKEIITAEDKGSTLSRVQGEVKMSAFSDCDLVIEAVTENLDLKLKLFRQIDEITPKDSLLCSNTSSISITKIAAVTSRPELVAGMHFMNPVPLMKLVEGIRGLQTSDETFARVQSFAEHLGKIFIESRDIPGFIVNRVLMPMINE